MNEDFPGSKLAAVAYFILLTCAYAALIVWYVRAHP